MEWRSCLAHPPLGGGEITAILAPALLDADQIQADQVIFLARA